MIIEIKQQTRYDGKAVFPGDTFEVDEAIALRWVENGIAEVVEEATPNTPPAAPDGADEGVDLESLSAKQLYKLCIEKGLDVAEKQAKEVYLEALKA